MPEPSWAERNLARHKRLQDEGLLDPGQPTVYSHRAYTAEMEAEFTPAERRQIRYLLGLGGEERAGA